MKLNLLPATVSRGRQSKTAWVGAVVIIFVGIGVSLALTITSKDALNKAKEAYDASIPPAQRAASTAAKADTYMADPNVVALVKNVSMAEAMLAHNDAYPALYTSLLPYIPPFFRLTSLAATPISDTQAAVTMTGTLTSYQQYADLMLALMRNPAAVSVARSGYISDEQYVPNLNEVDQLGRPRVPGQNPIPDDPLQRLAFFQANSQPRGFTGVSNFGSGTTNTRGAMPGESLVTVQLVLNSAIQTPNPRATLGGGGGGGGTGGFGGPGPGMIPGRGGPSMGGPGGPPSMGAPAGGPSAAGGRGRGIDD